MGTRGAWRELRGQMVSDLITDQYYGNAQVGGFVAILPQYGTMVANKMSNRPIKALDFRTTAEVITQKIIGLIGSVALQK